jgi:hypothetical protein
MIQRSSTSEDWPALPYAEWHDTLDTLHMFTQIVGKIRLTLAPDEPQWAQVPLYPTARGLSTSAMPWDDGAIDIEFDLIDHMLVVRTSRGSVVRLSLVDRSVADFYNEVMAELERLGVHVTIYTTPVEFAGPIPFPEDTVHDSYDRAAVRRFFDALSRIASVMHDYRARFRGRTSAVQFFWGTFDLANARYSGAPAYPGADADFIMRRAHDVEQVLVGFWPGDELIVQEAALYAYGFPQPDGIERAPIAPETAFWSDEHRLFLLRYDDVRRASDPRAAIREFFDSTYAACASLMDWSPALVG